MQVCIAYIQTSGGIFKCGIWPYPVLTIYLAFILFIYLLGCGCSFCNFILFRLILFISIINYNIDIVGWRTSSIRRNSELPKVLSRICQFSSRFPVLYLLALVWRASPLCGGQWEGSLDEKYPHIVYEEHCKACDAEQLESNSTEEEGSDKLEGLQLKIFCWKELQFESLCYLSLLI